MKPIRRKKRQEVIYDPITGQDRVLDETHEEDVLSDRGSVDSTGIHRKFFQDCGCDAESDGRCAQCQAISCPACHGRCHICQKPICLEHSSFIETEGQERMRLCSRCYGKVTRKQKWARVGRFFLATLVQEEQKHE